MRTCSWRMARVERLPSSVESGTASERVDATLAAGTYYVRVESRGTGTNDYILRYGVSAAEPGAQVLRVAEAPAFGEESYAFVLAENADGSVTRVLLGTVACGPTPTATRWATSMVGGQRVRACSSIDSSSGELYYVGAGENHESVSGPYALTVRAGDGTHTVDTAVTVTVGDEPEAPEFDARRAMRSSLAENADGSTTRVSLGTVAAEDPDDGDTVGYAIAAGNELGRFAIDASSGELYYVGSGEDHEGVSGPYELTVRAGDGTHTVDTTVTVTVTDEAEAPAFDARRATRSRWRRTWTGAPTRVLLGTVSGGPTRTTATRWATPSWAGNESGRFEHRRIER